jgi:hypothetical protein
MREIDFSCLLRFRSCRVQARGVQIILIGVDLLLHKVDAGYGSGLTPFLRQEKTFFFNDPAILSRQAN